MDRPPLRMFRRDMRPSNESRSLSSRRIGWTILCPFSRLRSFKSNDDGGPMKRREFMLSLSAAMAASAPLHAQQKSMPLVGSLSSFSPPANLDDLVRGSDHLGMGELGFVD